MNKLFVLFLFLLPILASATQVNYSIYANWGPQAMPIGGVGYLWWRDIPNTGGAFSLMTYNPATLNYSSATDYQIIVAGDNNGTIRTMGSATKITEISFVPSASSQAVKVYVDRIGVKTNYWYLENSTNATQVGANDLVAPSNVNRTTILYWGGTISFGDSLNFQCSGIPCFWYNATIELNVDANVTYFTPTMNLTTAGIPALFSVNWTSPAGLVNYTFSFDNGNGSYINDSVVSMVGASNWSNVTKTLNSTIGSAIRWAVYSWNVANLMNVTFNTNTTTGGDTTKPQWTLNSSNKSVAGVPALFSVRWTDETALNNYTFSFDNGNGSYINDSVTSMTGTANWSNVTKRLNSTALSAIRWAVYAWDTAGNMNVTFNSLTAYTNGQGFFLNASPWNDYVTGQQGNYDPQRLGRTYWYRYEGGYVESTWWKDGMFNNSDTLVLNNRTDTAWLINISSPGGGSQFGCINWTSLGFGNVNVSLNWTGNSLNVVEFNTSNPSGFAISGDLLNGFNTLLQYNNLPINIGGSILVCANSVQANYSLIQYLNFTSNNFYQSSPINYYGPIVNSSTTGIPVLFSVNWTGENGLNNYTFSLDNGNGSYINDSVTSMTGTANWSNVTKTLNSTALTTIRWAVYSWDIVGNFNVSNNSFTAYSSALPKYYSNASNNSVAGRPTLFSVNWTSVNGLKNYTFSFDNGNGTLYNASIGTAMTGVSNWSNVTQTINSTIGSVIRWKVYVWDAANNFNSTPILTFSTTDATPPNWFTPANNQTNNGSLTKFSVYWTDNFWLHNYTFSLDNGNGTFYNFSANQSMNGIANWSNVTWVLNASPASTIRWRVYAWDNSSNFNSTGIQTFAIPETTPPSWSMNYTNTTTAGLHANFSVRWTDDYALANYTFQLDNGNGTFYNSTTQSMTGTVNYSNTDWMLNSTFGSVVRWRYYANDSFGNFNATDIFTFTINDVTPPQWQQNQSNGTTAGTLTLFSVYWTDNVGLVNYTFSFDNGTGNNFVNDSVAGMTGPSNWSNVTKYVNETVGTTIRWRVFAWDAQGNVNTTSTFQYVTVSSPPPQYYQNSSNSTVAGILVLFSVNWTAPAGLANYTFSFDNGNGTLLNDSVASMTGISNWSNVTRTINSTIGSTIRWQYSVWDALGNFNQTPVYSFAATTAGIYPISMQSVFTDCQSFNSYPTTYQCGRNTTNYTAGSPINITVDVYTNISGLNITVIASHYLNSGTGAYGGTQANSEGVQRVTQYNLNTGHNFISFTFYTNKTGFGSNGIYQDTFGVQVLGNGGGYSSYSTGNVYFNRSDYSINVTNCRASSLSQANMSNYLVYDEQGGTLLNEPALNISGVASNGYANSSFNFTFIDTNDISLCIFPQWAAYFVTTSIVYNWFPAEDPSPYVQRSYYSVGNQTNNSENISLYLLLDTASSEVDIILKDYAGNVLSGYVVQAQKYYQDTGTFKIVQQFSTDYSGKVVMFLEPLTPTYKFTVLNGVGNLDGTFYPLYITSSDLISTSPNVYAKTLVINQPSFPIYGQQGHVTSSCSFDNFSAILTCTVTDDTIQAASINLTVSNLTLAGFTQFCSNSVTSYTGTLTCSVPNWNNSYFKYTVILTNSDGSTYLADAGIFDFRSKIANWGLAGFFITMLWVMILFFLGRWSLPVAFILAGFGFASAWFIGAFSVGLEYLIGMELIIVLLAWRSRS